MQFLHSNIVNSKLILNTIQVFNNYGLFQPILVYSNLPLYLVLKNNLIYNYLSTYLFSYLFWENVWRSVGQVLKAVKTCMHIVIQFLFLTFFYPDWQCYYTCILLYLAYLCSITADIHAIIWCYPFSGAIECRTFVSPQLHPTHR